MTIRTQLFLAFFSLILLFLLDFFATERLSKQVQTNMNYISKSEALIRNSNMIHKNIIEMQSGFRGFLLTDQPVFLQNYYRGLRVIPVLLEQQENLIDNNFQRQRLDSIAQLHKSWITYSDQLITAKRDSTPGGESRYIDLFENKLKMEVGKKMNDEIERLFYAFDTFEYSVRKERRSALQDSITATSRATLILTVVIIIVTGFLAYFFIRNITKRINTMVHLAEKISRGNFRTIRDDRKDELTQLSESLNTMSKTLDKNFKDLTRKNRELDQFAYVVSHDLKAPLRGISNITTWIDEDHTEDITPDVREKLELIKGRTLRLENMINGLLAYARVGKNKKLYQEVNIKFMLEDLRSMLVPPRFNFVMVDPLPVFITDKVPLEQIFSNLISNAVKYNNKPNGTITISSRELREVYEFTVADDGPGIQQEYFDKIFQIFQTLTERDAFESTGVGLAIVKKIVDDHKTNIFVRSVYGQGAEFVFTWPKHYQD